jgi:hypothetical protein
MLYCMKKLMCQKGVVLNDPPRNKCWLEHEISLWGTFFILLDPICLIVSLISVSSGIEQTSSLSFAIIRAGGGGVDQVFQIAFRRWAWNYGHKFLANWVVGNLSYKPAYKIDMFFKLLKKHVLLVCLWDMSLLGWF